VLSWMIKPRPRRITAVETTHPARSKAGKRVIMSAQSV
jgi:hypothetical protein